MPSHAACRREIESLHGFFVDWYTGRAEEDAYDRVERALAPDFEMVTPEGDRREYADVVDGIRSRRASHDPGEFGIEVRNVDTRHALGDHRLVRYEEWQTTPDGTTGRLSTALFEAAPDAPGGVVWLDLQETWLERSGYPARHESIRMGDSSLRTVGVLGGMSSQSTVEYYRLIDEGINDARGGHGAGDLVIRSVNFADIERLMRADRWDRAGEYLADAATDLEAAGAEFVVMATNTMHKVAPRIEAALSIPFVHIVDVAADAITDAGLETVGLLGTETVMGESFYRDRLADHGIDVVVPDPTDQAVVDGIIFEELTHGEIREESRETYLRVIDELVGVGAEGIVLGCTEIELLVDQADYPDVPVFDTTALHVDRAVAHSLGETDPGT